MEPGWLPADDLSNDDDGTLSAGKGKLLILGKHDFCQIDFECNRP